jgi:PBP1b-binding outer membrane lipoprotein LpoB
MKKNNSIIASFLLILFLNSCGTVAEGLGGSKKNGNEEFLVEKKSPLVLPPSFGELPEPGKEPEKNIVSSKKETSDIEDMINQSSSKSIGENNGDIENSIIEKIKEKKIIFKETTETNLDEALEEESEKPKKKGFFKKLITKSNNPDS